MSQYQQAVAEWAAYTKKSQPPGTLCRPGQGLVTSDLLSSRRQDGKVEELIAKRLRLRRSEEDAIRGIDPR